MQLLLITIAILTVLLCAKATERNEKTKRFSKVFQSLSRQYESRSRFPANAMKDVVLQARAASASYLSIANDFAGSECGGKASDYTAIRLNTCISSSWGGSTLSVGTYNGTSLVVLNTYNNTDCSTYTGNSYPIAYLGCNQNDDGTSSFASVGSAPGVAPAGQLHK